VATRRPERPRRAGAAAALLLLALPGGCAPAPLGPGAQSGELPAFALPQAEVMDPRDYHARDAITYRRLTRADFRGKAPPAQVAAHADLAGAFTCASIVPQGVARAVAEPSAKPGVYVARFEDAVFRAQMDRACSWWNPLSRDLPTEYVLEHEQIHFALTELGARHLTRALREVRVEAGPTDAPAVLERRFQALLNQAREELLRTNTEFDRDTSGRYAPERQHEWLERVERELAESATPEPA